MTGANYTGGKRNAARERSRDASGRLQRGHFSRQRLNILANSLVPRTLGTLHNYISLKHAGLDEKKPKVSQGLIEPAAEFSCFKASSARHSKVLEILDTEEPLSLRAQIDKILAVPDLLGLDIYARTNKDSLALPPSEHSSSEFESSPPYKKRRADESQVIGYHTSDHNTHVLSPALSSWSNSTRVSPTTSVSEHHIMLFSPTLNPRTPIKQNQDLNHYRASPIRFHNANIRVRSVSPPSAYNIHATCFPSTSSCSSGQSFLHTSSVEVPRAHNESSSSRAISRSSSSIHDHLQCDPKLNTFTGHEAIGSSDGASRLIHSLFRSSDPWALMGRRLLDLQTPPPSSRCRIRAKDMELLQNNLSKNGVGFVPPSINNIIIEQSERDSGGNNIHNLDSSQPYTQYRSTSASDCDSSPAVQPTLNADMPSERFVFPDYADESPLPSSDRGMLTSSPKVDQNVILQKPSLSEHDALSVQDQNGDFCHIEFDALQRSTVIQESIETELVSPTFSSMTFYSSPQKLSDNIRQELVPLDRLPQASNSMLSPTNAGSTLNDLSPFSKIKTGYMILDRQDSSYQIASQSTVHTKNSHYVATLGINDPQCDQYLEPTNSQLLDNLDVARDLHAGYLQRETETLASENAVELEKYQVEEEVDMCNGPRLFLDDVDDE